MKPKTRINAAATLAIVGLIAVVAPILFELRTIQKVRDQYYLDAAVQNEVINNKLHKSPADKPTVEEFLNPDYLKKYNLSMNDYIDSKGYFSPNGDSWIKWSLTSKIAAVLMFINDRKLSVWEVRRVVNMIDDYYSQNPKSVPIVEVANGVRKTALE